jgi:hypothetical protein
VGDVTADIRLEPASRGDQARVRVRLDPVDAAADARWFQVVGWQGGGLVIAEMEEVGPGEYESDRAVPVSGRWKAVLRLHRGGELMAAPIRFPGDPAIDAAGIPAADRRVAMAGERQFLLQETEPGSGWLSYAIHALLTLVVAGWAAVFTVATARIGASGRGRAAPAPGRGTVPFAKSAAG